MTLPVDGVKEQLPVTAKLTLDLRISGLELTLL